MTSDTYIGLYSSVPLPTKVGKNKLFSVSHNSSRHIDLTVQYSPFNKTTKTNVVVDNKYSVFDFLGTVFDFQDTIFVFQTIVIDGPYTVINNRHSVINYQSVVPDTHNIITEYQSPVFDNQDNVFNAQYIVSEYYHSVFRNENIVTIHSNYTYTNKYLSQQTFNPFTFNYRIKIISQTKV